MEEVSLLIATGFKWVKNNYTPYELHDGYSLGSLTEKGLEAANKHICVYL